MVVQEGLDLRLMDVVTAYLYGSLDSDIYMKIPDGFKMPNSSAPRELHSIKLQRSLYGLKQSGRMWYHRLSEYLIREGYKNDHICPCVFIKRSETGFAIIAVYVDDMNLIGTRKELANAAEYLKKEFEVKDLGKTKLCLVLSLPEDTGMVLNIFLDISVVLQIWDYFIQRMQLTKGISWRSTKQTLVATSSNHSEIIALYEAGRECVWLRSVISHIQNSCQLHPVTASPTVIYEDNAACIAQTRGGYIKGDRTKHISPKFFHTHELQKNGEIDVRQGSNGVLQYSFSLMTGFVPLGFPAKVFNEAAYAHGLD
ncbi:PREDICTED: uncharacterized protein LOC105962372 [Erythranthe guttata]|uniref:uncharacterized protein LOC105962372 n=1 Tax=Erythranthe guttata TaxID=4155 RepID=UPI00064D9695|nr:PREDICTED: uncharacterized protein LOC105962372 [Erythranthe guttata]|eukprot:XP_012842126.1 PREDICTED: uncharacterized protein LOC105962372 [Erythranthe guttata]